jgi:4-hydroxy-tetrahydrodipicolinate reductase
MGRTIASLVEREDRFEVASVFETPETIELAGGYGAASGYSKNPVILTSEAAAAVRESDVVIDFSLSSAFDEVVGACRAAVKPLVTGTTGIIDKQKRLKGLADRVAVVSAPNMSVGMNVIFALCYRLADVMGKSSDLEIIETHHRTKRDIPSGTAGEIARILSQRTGKPVVVGRAAGTGERADEIVIHSLRAGDIPGGHSVLFMPEGETVEISHTARSRVCFAEGALRAARFAVGSPPGLYSMLEVLGLEKSKEG